MVLKNDPNVRFATFCERRANLYRTYSEIHLEDLRIKKQVKLARHDHQLQKKLDGVRLELMPKETLRSMSVDRDVLSYKKSLRMQYRVLRESTRRKIAKQATYAAVLNGEPILVEDNKSIAQVFASFKDKLARSIAKSFAIKDFDADALNKALEDTLAKHEEMLQARESALNAQFEEWWQAQSHDIEASRARYDEINAQIIADNTAYKAKLDGEFAKREENFVKFNDKRVAMFDKMREDALARVKGGTNSKIEELADDVVLKVDNLSMHFGGLKAVDELSFEVKKGEIFGLIGPNGAGKTTVFNCITQFYKPTAGNLTFKQKDGRTIRLTDYVVHDIILKGIARTFQNVEVVKEVSVLENLLIAATRQYSATIPEQMLHLPILKKEERIIRARAEKVLDYMNLSMYRDRLAWGLPYGILKRIEIARVLMCNPQLIILDEPAAGLNDSETQELATLIRKIAKDFDCTILLVEHDMGLVMDICDHICAISFGRKLAFGTAEEIQASKEVQEAYLGVEGDE